VHPGEFCGLSFISVRCAKQFLNPAFLKGSDDPLLLGVERLLRQHGTDFQLMSATLLVALGTAPSQFLSDPTRDSPQIETAQTWVSFFVSR